MKRHLTDEADSRLAFYLPMPEQPPGVELPPRPVLPEGIVDTPLVRLYNFLREHICLQCQKSLPSMANFRDYVFILPAGNSLVSG